MTKEQVEKVLEELEWEEDYTGLVKILLRHVKDDRTAKQVNRVEELFAHANPNVKLDIANEWHYTLIDFDLTKEEAKRVIMTVYFIAAALDVLAEKAIVSKKDFKDNINNTIFRLQQILLWGFRNSLFTGRGTSFYLQFVDAPNQIATREIDITIRIDFDKTCGYMNWPLAVKVFAVDPASGSASVSKSVDFIKCLEDFNFNNIQKAINLVC